MDLAQLQKSNELAAQGWVALEIKNASMNGPIIMRSPANEYVQVLSDGSTQPYTGMAMKETAMGPKSTVVSRGKVVGEQG